MSTIVFLEILNMSLAGGCVIVLVLLARLFLKRAPKFFSYSLWAVALFRLVCPFSFESKFSLFPMKVNPIPQDIVYAAVPKITTGLPALDQGINQILPPAAFPNSSVNPIQIWLFIGANIWLLGVVALLIYSVITLLNLQKTLQTATLLENGIYEVSGLKTAFVTGLFSPKIYLPMGLSAVERDYILLHEQTHIRRLDHILRLFSFFVLCLHWFNPLVWLAFFISGKDMEMACDESVLKAREGTIKKEYSTSLLALATGQHFFGGAPLAFGEGDTKSRIKNVLRYQKPRVWALIAAAVFVLCLAIGLAANPKNQRIVKPSGYAGINATILKIDKANQAMLVKSIDKDSPIGNTCIVTWEGTPFSSITWDGAFFDITLDDFDDNDTVVLFLSEINIILPTNFEHFPSEAIATRIQRQPEGAQSGAHIVQALWEARTSHVGDNVAVRKLVDQLPIPREMQLDHIKLKTSSRPYHIEIVYTVSREVLEDYETRNNASDLEINAMILLALVDNVDEIHASITDGTRSFGFIYSRQWAEDVMGEDLRKYSASVEILYSFVLNISGMPDREFSIAKLGEGGVPQSKFVLKDQTLAAEIWHDVFSKSAAFEGVDITTLDNYYHMQQINDGNSAPLDYYIYLLEDGTAVLQSGQKGRYSTLSKRLYDQLVTTFAGA